VILYNNRWRQYNPLIPEHLRQWRHEQMFWTTFIGAMVFCIEETDIALKGWNMVPV